MPRTALGPAARGAFPEGTRVPCSPTWHTSKRGSACVPRQLEDRHTFLCCLLLLCRCLNAPSASPPLVLPQPGRGAVPPAPPLPASSQEQSQALLGSTGQAVSEWLCSQLACCFGVGRSLLELRWCAQNQLCFLSVLAAVSLMTKISPIPLPSPGTRSFLSAAAVLPCAAHGPPYGCKTQNEVSSISSAQQNGAEW